MSMKKVKKESEYEKCKSKSIDQIMKLYESGNLIIRKKRIINRKQAIAIGLQQAESKCSSKINKSDVENIIEKVEKIDKINYNFNYSDIKRILFLIDYYKKNKKYNKVDIYQTYIIKYLLCTVEIKSSIKKLIISAF